MRDWIAIPLMNANLDVVFRKRIPVEIQGRGYSARNTLQFLTIPIGYTVSGFLVDRVFEPFMAAQTAGSIGMTLFGIGKESGSAFLFALLWLTGVMTCVVFRKDKHIWALEKQ